ncbi:aldehyde dehydrogenase family protein [Thermoflavimicrobium daqui]|uniref:Aldehyde dehydrogenase n=1 Tax=Thermoflavimicrobium daqui TaxID=2137476 RepID=A0A364K1K4_9BACL|nr:aldehyde dehydrogenase family protein [Thermoflavimicrobium daqui]RAL21904.1 aldehyde dehydrogenase [Thermoflavimicrobium daqui]
MAKFQQWNKQWIGGQWKIGLSQKNYINKNPYNDEVLVEIPLANMDDVDQAYESSQAAQREWEKVNPYKRSAIMEKAAELLAARREEMVELLVAESGSTRIKANTEIDFAIAIIKEAASFPIRMQGMILPSLVPGKENRIYRYPAGVVGVISPFNFPFYLSMRSVAPALATGNGVVLKPDRQTMITGGLAIAKLFDDAGIPKGLFNVTVVDTKEIGDAFVEHPIPRIISFTGSTEVGRHIGELCGKNLKRVALELGGNNALIVLQDADIEKAAHSAAFGKFMHQGQICMAINRIIVDRNRYDEFLERFKERVSKIKAGDPSNPDTFVGPLINRKQVDRILDLIDKSVRQGAKVVLEGKVQGNVMEPFILADVTNDMPIAQNEIFGPVAGVIAVDGEEEAIRVANDSPYGLSGAVYAGSVEHGVEVAKKIETGMIHVNDQSVNDEPIIAFGGEKASGLGRYGGMWALDEFTTVKWISVQVHPREYPV